MTRVVQVLGLVTLWLAVVWTSDKVAPYEQCSGQNIEGLQDKVGIHPCGKSRCKLKKGTNTTITILLKPDHDVATLTTDVYGILGGIPLPFVGVAGTSACDSITKADSSDPVGCPLQAGVEYKYTKSFPIEEFYPAVSVKVHWALNDGKKDIICFEVPAVIK